MGKFDKKYESKDRLIVQDIELESRDSEFLITVKQVNAIKTKKRNIAIKER